MKKLAIVAFLTGLAACVQLAPVREKIVTGVEAYCREPLENRLLLRAAVNESLMRSGATIKVTCPGDSQ